MIDFIVNLTATVIGVIVAEMIISAYYESEYEIYEVDHQDGE